MSCTKINYSITFFYKTRAIPTQFESYEFLSQSKHSDFEVIQLNNPNYFFKGSSLFRKENGNYILLLIQEMHNDDQDEVCSKLIELTAAGVVLAAYIIPSNINFIKEQGLLIGKGGLYCNWLIDGDTTIYEAKKIDKELSSQDFVDYFAKATQVHTYDKYSIFFDSHSMLKIDNEWYYAALNKSIIFPDSFDFDNTSEVSKGNNFVVDTSTQNNDFFYKENDHFTPVFSSYPVTINDLEFSFYAKSVYYQGGSSSKIGSPTGGSSWSTTWKGEGFFKLKFGNIKFCFKDIMKYEQTANANEWKYRQPFALFKADLFALIEDSFTIYLIKM